MDSRTKYDLNIRNPLPCRPKRCYSAASETRSTVETHLIGVTVLVCVSTIAATVCIVVLSVGNMKKDLEQIKEDLIKMETYVRRFTDYKKEKQSFRHEMVFKHPESNPYNQLSNSWSEEVDNSLLQMDARASENDSVPLTQSRHTNDVIVPDDSPVHREIKVDQLKRSVRQTAPYGKKKQKNSKNKGADTKRTNKSLEHVKAVHFHPKNSSARTITTKMNSPVLDFWQESKWSTLTNQSFYHRRDGTITILEDGLYFIYAQLVFHDLSGRWSFSVNINERQELKCINSEHIPSADTLHPSNHGVYQHCFSSSLFYVQRLEQVTIRCLYEQRNILLSPEFTFWGIIKMS